MDIDEILKVLANPARREILASLKEPEQNFPGQTHPYDLGVCAGKIDQRCGLSQSTVSSHLASLQRAGLITCHRSGQWSFFRRNEETISRFLEALQQQL
jgi:ArsR family transcriptional regulator